MCIRDLNVPHSALDVCVCPTPGGGKHAGASPDWPESYTVEVAYCVCS